ncbi:MAG: hypothetical protein DCF30_21185 [Hyphomicrobiales bacterium]|nr:MAG: hypothetical protein DCF30_21185 [Hyphomicrobiales bacterium]
MTGDHDDPIDAKRLRDIFAAMDEAASGDPVKREHQILCVFGAAAILSYGSTARQTQDIDIWRPASRLNDRALRQMAEAAGIDYNPTELEPQKAYLQIVDDGVVKMPSYNKEAFAWANGQKSENIWSGDNITIVAPPPAIVAAAKMVRAEPQDIEDVAFLMNAKGISAKEIKKAIRHFPSEARARASENMIYLEFANPSEGKGLAIGKGKGYGE